MVAAISFASFPKAMVVATESTIIVGHVGVAPDDSIMARVLVTVCFDVV